MYEGFQNGDCRTLNQALYPVELHSLHAPGVDLELSVSQGASPDMLGETILHCTAYLTSLAPGHYMLVLTKMPPKRSYYSPLNSWSALHCLRLGTVVITDPRKVMCSFC